MLEHDQITALAQRAQAWCARASARRREQCAQLRTACAAMQRGAELAQARCGHAPARAGRDALGSAARYGFAVCAAQLVAARLPPQRRAVACAQRGRHVLDQQLLFWSGKHVRGRRQQHRESSARRSHVHGGAFTAAACGAAHRRRPSRRRVPSARPRKAPRLPQRSSDADRHAAARPHRRRREGSARRTAVRFPRSHQPRGARSATKRRGGSALGG